MTNRLLDKLIPCPHSWLLRLAPPAQLLPLPAQRYDEPLLPYSRTVISVTHDLVCGYIFDLAAYLAWGAPGAIALERSLALVDREWVRILHGPFVGPAYAAMAFESTFDADAVTLASAADLEYYPQGALVVCQGMPDTNRGYPTYWPDVEQVLLPDGATLRVVTHLPGYGVDFADTVRNYIKGLADG
jgi:hypothetical protein